MSVPAPDPRFRLLTPELLARVSADEIGDAVVQHVYFHRAAHPGEPHGGIDRLPPGLQAIYATWMVDVEVNNGGFHQFFFNPYGELAGHALRGYELLGAEEYAAVMRAAIATYEAERELLRPFREEGTLEAFAEGRRHAGFDEIDRRYYSLGDQIYAIWAVTVHDRPELFAP